jgi:hypothetical protein
MMGKLVCLLIWRNRLHLRFRIPAKAGLAVPNNLYLPCAVGVGLFVVWACAPRPEGARGTKGSICWWWRVGARVSERSEANERAHTTPPAGTGLLAKSLEGEDWAPE